MEKKELDDFKEYWGICEDKGNDELKPTDIISSEGGTDETNETIMENRK